MSFFLLFLFVGFVFGGVLERPDSFPTSIWIEESPTHGNTPIKLIFAIKQQNTEQLRDILLDVSDPNSDNYGNFMTTYDIQELIKPKRKAIKAVYKWLLHNGIDIKDIKPEKKNKDLISIETTIEFAEKLLNCQYYDYKHYKENITVSRVKMNTDYYVPSYMERHLDLITPTHRFPYIPELKKGNVGAGAITPTDLKALYTTGNAEGKAPDNLVAISSYSGEYWKLSDVQTLWSTYNIPTTTITSVPASTPQGEGLEAELDVQYMTAMSAAVPMQAWYTSGGFSDALLSWATNVLNDKNPPKLFTTSYGLPESSFGIAFCNRLNTDLAAMGTAGISVFYSSGDYGAGGGCSRPPFELHYPGSSPYVTTVGGTTGGKAGQQPTDEVAWSDGGGGFSNYVGTQPWQMDAVKTYLSTANNLPASNCYNASGRGYPDISAQAVDFIIIINGRQEGVSGTSCSCPTSGGIFGLLNDLRLQNGMKQLGFLNPLIYSIAANDTTAFNDVTSGSNRGCYSEDTSGFPAVKGWDAVTGVGTPNYAVLKNYVLQTGQKTKKWVK